MATPWSSSTAYSPNAVVSYKGLDYIRSKYPPTATTGTAPNVETSVDPNNDTIRTWSLNTPLFDPSPLLKLYFRTAYPSLDSKGEPEFAYSGGQFLQMNAYDYDPLNPPEQYFGTSSEYDQYKNNESPTPDSPVCPANECGVAMQQGGEGTIYVTANPTSSGKTRYIYVTFNHPLYFRRTITVMTRITVRTINKNPPNGPPDPEVVTEDLKYTTYFPDDRNYCSDLLSSNYFVPANAAFSIVVPNDVNNDDVKITYDFTGLAVVGVSAGD